MRTVTATEASRSFAALLDEVERGGTVVITRAGVRVAVIGPTSSGNGSSVVSVLTGSDVDARFADDVLAAGDNVTWEGPECPDA